MANKALGPTGEFFRRRDEWRKHPRLTNQLRHATPGLGIALVAFGIYLVGEQVYNRVYAPLLLTTTTLLHLLPLLLLTEDERLVKGRKLGPLVFQHSSF